MESHPVRFFLFIGYASPAASRNERLLQAARGYDRLIAIGDYMVMVNGPGEVCQDSFDVVVNGDNLGPGLFGQLSRQPYDSFLPVDM